MITYQEESGLYEEALMVEGIYVRGNNVLFVSLSRNPRGYFLTAALRDLFEGKKEKVINPDPNKAYIEVSVECRVIIKGEESEREKLFLKCGNSRLHLDVQCPVAVEILKKWLAQL